MPASRAGTYGRSRYSMPSPKCMICRKPCRPEDRNSDGTYAHDHCLRALSMKPVGRGDKGGNLYKSDRP